MNPGTSSTQPGCALVDGPEPFSLSALVAVGSVRIVTNTRIYPNPTPLPVALAVVEQLARHPRCRLASPGPSHLDGVIRLCRASGASGKHVADAQHAALAISEGCTGLPGITTSGGSKRTV